MYCLLHLKPNSVLYFAYDLYMVMYYAVVRHAKQFFRVFFIFLEYPGQDYLFVPMYSYLFCFLMCSESPYFIYT